MRGIVTLKTATTALWFTASEALNFYLEGLFSVDTQGTPLPDRNGVRIELDWNDVQRVEIALRDAGLLGKISFDEAYQVYKEQIESLKEADLLIIETISDIKELRQHWHIGLVPASQAQ